MNISKIIPCFSMAILMAIMYQDGLAQKPEHKTLEYIDRVYEENIKTAVLFPSTIPLFNQIPIVLSFDELFTDQAEYYKGMIIHCDMHWQPSNLSELQYLYEYNEFNIDEFDFSIATKVPYTHFTAILPRVKLPGNYLLVVYRGSDKDDVIISKRFMVFDQKIMINGTVELSSGVSLRNSNQQISFNIDYTKFPIPNPYLDIQVVVKQNDRWDNAIYDLKPTMVKEDIFQLEYRHFNFENNFRGGNEFRFFDIRSTHFGGRNVEKFNISDTQIDAYLFIDKPRSTQPYTFNEDMNGGFIIQNTEGRDNLLESDYINVHFFLDLDQQIEQDIYISGKLTNWRYGDSNKMRYVEASGMYMANLLLKQGIYDFSYMIPSNIENPSVLEGNHFETRNMYEIIIYYKDQMLNTDMIIGYFQLL